MSSVQPCNTLTNLLAQLLRKKREFLNLRTKHIDCVRLRPLNNTTNNEEIAQGITLTHIFSNCSYLHIHSPNNPQIAHRPYTFTKQPSNKHTVHIHSPNNPQINPQSRYPKSLFRRCDLITALISGLHLRAPCAHSRVLPLVQSKQKRISKRNPRCPRTKLRKPRSLTSGEIWQSGKKTGKEKQDDPGRNKNLLQKV